MFYCTQSARVNSHLQKFALKQLQLNIPFHQLQGLPSVPRKGTEFIQVLCYFVTRIDFPSVSNNMVLISNRDITKMTFNHHISTKPCSGLLKSSLRKLRLSFQLYSFLSSKLPLMVDSQQFFFFLVCTSKLFQPFPNTQFQSLFHGVCYNNIPTFCLSFRLSSFRLL